MRPVTPVGIAEARYRIRRGRLLGDVLRIVQLGAGHGVTDDELVRYLPEDHRDFVVQARAHLVRDQRLRFSGTNRDGQPVWVVNR